MSDLSLQRNNDCSTLIHRLQAATQVPSATFAMQVIKCRVRSTDLSHQRLKLSLMGKKSNADGSAAEGSASGDPLGGLQPGDVVSGTVREVETVQVCVAALFTVVHLPAIFSGYGLCADLAGLKCTARWLQLHEASTGCHPL